MASENADRDLNRITVMLAVTDDADKDIFQVRGNPITKRLLVDNDALPENTDGTYIGDIKFGESLPTGTNYLGQVGITGSITVGDVEIQETVPTDSSKNNASFVLIYGTNDNLVTVVQTIGGTAYNKTLIYDANNNLTSASAWVEQ